MQPIITRDAFGTGISPSSGLVCLSFKSQLHCLHVGIVWFQGGALELYLRVIDW